MMQNVPVLKIGVSEFMKILFLAILCTVFLAGPSTAEPRMLNGSAMPEFQSAVETWLNGHDLEGLQALADLSRTGNTVAQILLAGIADRGTLHTHVTADLPRKERVALLRIPKGLSGKSWLTEAMVDEPLATALLQVRKVGEKAPAIGALIEYGEPFEALLAASSLLQIGEAEKLYPVLIGREDLLPEEADPILIWTVFQKKYNKKYGKYAGSNFVASLILKDNRYLTSEFAWLPPSPPLNPDAVGRPVPVDQKAVKRWGNAVQLSGEVRTWTPIRTYCEQHCASKVKECTALGARYLIGVFPLRSPRESIVSNERYWSSPRIEGDLARNVPDVSRIGGWPYGDTDSCFVSSMKVTQAQHRLAKTP
jgi:hypothetical protein